MKVQPSIATLKKREKALEKRPTKGAAEKKLERQISKRIGRRYVGKR